MKNKNHIHEYQVTVTGFQNNGVPVSMDMLVHAKTETAAMIKAEDILMNTYGIDNAITESIELNTYPCTMKMAMQGSDVPTHWKEKYGVNWTYFTGKDFMDEDGYISL